MSQLIIQCLNYRVKALLVAGLLWPGWVAAQQHLSLWDTTSVQRCKLDISVSLPFDESQPLNRTLINPTINWHETLVKADPAQGDNEAVVMQFSLGASTASAFIRQDTAHRYVQLLTPGVVHGALSLIGAHYVDEHIRIWAQGSLGLRLHNYRPDPTGSNYQVWQRYAGLGGGIGYRRSMADRNDRFAMNVLWGQASYDISEHTKETFSRQFGPDPTASFVELSARARLCRLGTNGVFYLTYSWKRFYNDYDKPGLALVGVSAVFPIGRDNSAEAARKNAADIKAAAEKAAIDIRAGAEKAAADIKAAAEKAAADTRAGAEKATADIKAAAEKTTAAKKAAAEQAAADIKAVAEKAVADIKAAAEKAAVDTRAGAEQAAADIKAAAEKAAVDTRAGAEQAAADIKAGAEKAAADTNAGAAKATADIKAAAEQAATDTRTGAAKAVASIKTATAKAPVKKVVRKKTAKKKTVGKK